MGFSFNEMQQKSNGGTERVCRMLEKNLPEDLLNNFQIIPSRVSGLQENKIRVYFLHDLAQDPETNHIKNEQSRNRFQKIVFCGHWQYNQYLTQLNISPTNQLAVFDNPVEPIPFIKKSKNEIRLIYTSTPQRGLSLLIPVFEKLCETHDNIRLDVFSSFEIYGWGQADAQYQDLFKRCKDHPKIFYHGSKDNETVRIALQKAHIFAYPSIWQECNSCALIEAMSAGLLCLHPNFAGLSDTSGGLTSMYQYTDNQNEHANLFYHLLNHSINEVNSDNAQNYLQLVKAYADTRFNILKISAQWKDLLINLNHQYPTLESRKFPSQTFIYKTSYS
jgi:UDP-glucose:(glucosyl)LPS alpha-1,2-glucosyltransferase